MEAKAGPIVLEIQNAGAPAGYEAKNLLSFSAWPDRRDDPHPSASMPSAERAFSNAGLNVSASVEIVPVGIQPIRELDCNAGDRP